MSERNYFLAQYGSHEHIEKIMDGDDDELKIHVMSEHPAPSSDNIHHALESKNSNVRHAALRCPTATEDHLRDGVNSIHWAPRMIAAVHPNINDYQHKKLLSDPNSMVRGKALENVKTTDEHLQNALNDPDEHVRAHVNRLIAKRKK